jgi:hypothetical protein
VTFVVEADEVAYPVNVSLLCGVGQMLFTDRLTNRIH